MHRMFVKYPSLKKVQNHRISASCEAKSWNYPSGDRTWGVDGTPSGITITTQRTIPCARCAHHYNTCCSRCVDVFGATKLIQRQTFAFGTTRIVTLRPLRQFAHQLLLLSLLLSTQIHARCLGSITVATTSIASKSNNSTKIFSLFQKSFTSFIRVRRQYYRHPPPKYSLQSSQQVATRIRSATASNNKIKMIMKAWTCHGRNQHEMVYKLQQAGIIQSDEVYRVMRLVDRKNYFPTNTGASNNSTSSLPSETSSSSSYSYYTDTPNAIGYGQTISAPHMHAFVLEEIISHFKQQPWYNNKTTTTLLYQNNQQHPISASSSSYVPDIQLLDVGCGSGYITACFGRWLQQQQRQQVTSTSSYSIFGNRTGYAYGIDIIPELVQLSTNNMMKQDADLLLFPSGTDSRVPTANGNVDNCFSDCRTTDSSKMNSTTTSNNPTDAYPTKSIVSLYLGNGYEGLPHFAPYDIIHVGAAASSFPKALCQQLKVGGMMIVPLQDHIPLMNQHCPDNDKNITNSDEMTTRYTSTSTLMSQTQTLYKIERVLAKCDPSPSTATTTGTTTTTNTTRSLSATSHFDWNEYRMTPLLGVRYVPLVHSTTTTTYSSSSSSSE
jgi:protein-L-isoaspartate(D-aspartate) O-methyltransferase